MLNLEGKLLNKYRGIVGDEVVDKIFSSASSLSGKHAVHVNATYYGGGVVEILNSLVPLMNDAGIITDWRLIKGEKAFFETTKKFHNALQGHGFYLTKNIKRIYIEGNRNNAVFTHLEDHDFVVIHDPQPLALINCYKKRRGRWFWRCHIDISNPNKELFSFLKPYIEQYDKMIVSIDKFKQRLKVPQVIIPPSINPLSDKNKELSSRIRRRLLSKRGIDLDRPIIAQVSRFDPWKDPLGVINSFLKVRAEHKCQLVLLGNVAADDPEGPKIYAQVLKKVEHVEEPYKSDIKILLEDNDLLVNALQTESAVVLQKSLREGFALTVSEALWKGTPVVGGNVGGIPLQVIDGKTGYLVNSIDECAKRVAELIKNPKLAKKLGETGREHVRQNFLITRHLLDYIMLFKGEKCGFIKNSTLYELLKTFKKNVKFGYDK